MGDTTVRLVHPASWLDHTDELSNVLAAAIVAGRRAVAARGPADPAALVVEIDNPRYWVSHADELRAALNAVCGDSHAATSTSSAPAAFPAEDRLTLSVEQAAAALGISRALAYDAVARGEIPCIRIGRRILIPRAQLSRLLDTPPPQDGDDDVE